MSTIEKLIQKGHEISVSQDPAGWYTIEVDNDKSYSFNGKSDLSYGDAADWIGQNFGVHASNPYLDRQAREEMHEQNAIDLERNDKLLDSKEENLKDFIHSDYISDDFKTNVENSLTAVITNIHYKSVNSPEDITNKFGNKSNYEVALLTCGDVLNNKLKEYFGENSNIYIGHINTVKNSPNTYTFDVKIQGKELPVTFKDLSENGRISYSQAIEKENTYNNTLGENGLENYEEEYDLD